MLITILTMMTVLPALPVRDDDTVTITSVSELAEFMAPGPNTGQQRLPTPQTRQAPPDSASPSDSPPVNAGAVHFALGVDVTNAYYWRGLRQEDDGLIAQPYASVGMDFYSTDDVVLQGIFGTWHSLHSEDTGATSSDDTIRPWYEADAYAGLGATIGDWQLGLQYNWYASPNGAFSTIEELQLSVSLDDSEILGKWAMSPSITLAFETGDATSDGLDKGVYLQFGVAPGFDVESETLKGLRFSAPIVLGLSASDYYQDSSGEDEFFGFLSAGVRAAIALPINEKYGEWEAYVAANVLFLGDTTSALNNDDDTEFVVAAGVSMSY